MSLVTTMLSCISGPNNVTGPATTTLNAIARFGNTAGDLLENSGVLIDNSNNISGASSLTLGTPLALASGGTNAALTASTGGIVYSTGAALAILSGVAANNRIVISKNNAAPEWSSFSLTLGGNFSTDAGVSINDDFATIGSVLILGSVDLQDDLSTDGIVDFVGAFAFIANITAATNITFPIAGTLANVPPAPTIQKFTGGSGTYNKNYSFLISSGSATVGATYTNNGITYTAYETVASSTLVVMRGSGPPSTTGTLTKASGTGDATLTFTYVWAPRYLKVQVVGGGGGGGGSGTSSGTPTGGGTGGDSTFGSTLFIGNGGLGGGVGAIGAPSAGGTAGTASLTGSRGFAIPGSGGACGTNTIIDYSSGTRGFGGNGGASFFGGAGKGGATFAAGTAGAANSGGGGGGGGCSTGTTFGGGGGGGGSGGYTEGIVASPSNTYAYAVGAGGCRG